MPPRPLAALPGAIHQTRRVLLYGFTPSRWLRLAFVGWLATLGMGRLRLHVPGPSPAVGMPSVDETWWSLWPWVGLGVAVLVLIGLFLAGIWTVVLFLRSRGAFLLVDVLVRDRGDLWRTWDRFGALADEVFFLRLELAAGMVALTGLALGSGLGSMGVWWWLDRSAPLIVPVAGCVALFTGTLAGGVVLAYHLAVLVLDELVVPVMYVRRCSVDAAMGFVADRIHRYPGAFLRYALARSAVGLLLWTLGAALWVLFCCVQWIPFLDALWLVPLRVLLRAWTLGWVAQLADDLAWLGPAP